MLYIYVNIRRKVDAAHLIYVAYFSRERGKKPAFEQKVNLKVTRWKITEWHKANIVDHTQKQNIKAVKITHWNTYCSGFHIQSNL